MKAKILLIGIITITLAIGSGLTALAMGGDGGGTMGRHMNGSKEYTLCSTMGDHMNDSTMGDHMNDNTMGDHMNGSTMGDHMNGSTMGDHMNGSTMGDHMNGNTMGDHMNGSKEYSACNRNWGHEQ